MSVNVFISFDHDDQQQVAGFKLINTNPNHKLDFRDHSLKEAVTDRSGKPVKYPPSDARSKPVRDEIIRKFKNASKLVVLIGDETYKSDWVEWEVNTFYKMKYPLSGENTWKRIRGMKLKGSGNARAPGALGGQSTEALNWNPDVFHRWLARDPDK